jgi:hypothetical protein
MASLKTSQLISPERPIGGKKIPHTQNYATITPNYLPLVKPPNPADLK